jgi:DNA-binding HxlR family transcriptional regulator
VAHFRYAQFCPVARAVELLGERWTLLIGRELLIGPQRFSDLLRRLPGLSSSVLSDRLAASKKGLTARRELPPPTPAVVYELTESGLGLKPLLYELARFGLRFMGRREPGDHSEPDWLRLALDVFARRTPTPARVFDLCVSDGKGELRIQIAGGPDGTRMGDAGAAPDATVFASTVSTLGLVSGARPRRRCELGSDPCRGSRRAARAAGSLISALSRPDPTPPADLPPPDDQELHVDHVHGWPPVQCSARGPGREEHRRSSPRCRSGRNPST